MQVALPVGQVLAEMAHVKDKKVVYLGHPVVVGPGDGAHVHSHGDSSGGGGHGEAGGHGGRRAHETAAGAGAAHGHEHAEGSHEDPLQALRTIELRMQSSGCRLLWNNPDNERAGRIEIKIGEGGVPMGHIHGDEHMIHVSNSKP